MIAPNVHCGDSRGLARLAGRRAVQQRDPLTERRAIRDLRPDVANRRVDDRGRRVPDRDLEARAAVRELRRLELDDPGEPAAYPPRGPRDRLLAAAPPHE